MVAFINLQTRIIETLSFLICYRSKTKYIRSHSIRQITHFLTFETEFVLLLAALTNSVLPMGRDISHATLNVTSEL